MQDDLYAARLGTQLVAPMRQRWDLEALKLTDFEWLNAGLLVRHRQREARPRPLFVALPHYADDLAVGLRAATAAAWLAGHEAPIGHGPAALLKAGDHVFHDQGIWLVQSPADAAGRVGLKRYSDTREPNNRSRAVPAHDCRKLLAPFEFADLLNPQKSGLAGTLYLKYIPWLDGLLARTRQARRTFRMADPDSLPRPHAGHTLLLVPLEMRYPQFAEAVLGQLAGAPVWWPRRTAAGADHWNLPFAPSVHVVSSLAEALELRRKKPGIKDWHLSVVGKAAVGNSLRVAQLVQAYDNEQWASLTFWGPDLGVGETPGCVVWPWSRTEARGPQAPPDPVRLSAAPLPEPTIETASLPTLVAAVRDVLNQLSQPPAVDVLPVRLPMVWNLLHRCLRFALPPGTARRVSREYLADLQHKITECLESEEIDEAFFGSRRRWPERVAAGAALSAAFTALLSYYHTHSPKYDTLYRLATEALEEGRPVLLVADRESLAATQSTWQPVPGVEVLPLLGTADNVRHRLLKNKVPADAVLLVPFLFNRDQLALLQTAPGPVHLVLLAQVEDGLHARTLASQQQQELAQRRAGGRTTMLGKSYGELLPEAEIAPQPSGWPASLSPLATGGQLSYFDELYAVGDARYAGERQRGRASGQLFTFTFTNGDRTELDGHTRVLRREPTGPDGAAEWIPSQADQLQPGQQVMIYENDQRELIARILRQHDRNGLVRRIDVASTIWQKALQQLADHYPNTNTLNAALQVRGGLDVGLQTLRHYLDGKRRFPGDPTTLPALVRLAEHLGLLQCPLLAPGAMEEVKFCRTKFQQLTIALGKGLSEEVLRYRLTGSAGKLLNTLDPDTRELVLLSAVERTIREIRKK